MRIIGGKYLDSNNYRRIQVSDDKISISKSDQEALFYDNAFVNSLKNKTDNRQVYSIIERYLKYNKINYISSDYVGSTNNKKLFVNRSYGNDIVRKVIEKYKSDRLDSLAENECSNYSLHLSKRYSCYDNEGNFYLLNQDNVLYDGEVMFLYDLIDYIYKGDIAYIIYDNGKMKVFSIGNDKTIDLSMGIVKNCMTDICYAVSEHNQNIFKNEEKVIQLKLEV